MCKATLHLISPSGVPITLHIAEDDDQQSIFEMLARADKIGDHARKQNWSFANTTHPSNREEPVKGPTFAGFPCSPTVDDRGLPTWLIVDGKQALRREKQGDIWYSIKRADDTYEQVLRIPKGEQVTSVHAA
jgi:hypothetical protein